MMHHYMDYKKIYFWMIILLCMFLAHYKVQFQNVAFQLNGVRVGILLPLKYLNRGT